MQALTINSVKVPLEIKDIFFTRTEISFTPAEQGRNSGETLTHVAPRSYVIKSTVSQPDPDDPHAIMVGVWVNTDSEENTGTLTHFDIENIGLYRWENETLPNEEDFKSAYSWAVAVQMGAIRQHVAEKTANGPYRTPVHIPIFLVRAVEEPREPEE